MKNKITICIVLALLYLVLGAVAQEPSAIKPLKVGDKLPDILFETILNHPKSSARLSAYKGKVILLDFWATWCGSCIKSFPKIDSIQRSFQKRLQVILIDNSSRDDLQKINSFLAKRKAEWPNFSLPIVPGNKATKALFNRGSLPHYIWIGYDRKVKAITGPDEVTPANIAQWVAGLPLELPLKEDAYVQ